MPPPGRHLHGGRRAAVRCSAGRSGGTRTPGHGRSTITGAAQVGEALTAAHHRHIDDDGLSQRCLRDQWLPTDAEHKRTRRHSFHLHPCCRRRGARPSTGEGDLTDDGRGQPTKSSPAPKTSSVGG
ncbi:hypothetical protein GBAR_LOCUS27518, partial [Geodia barretti]